MTPPPTPPEDVCRERVLVALLQHLADDHMETVTLDIDLAAWLLNKLNDAQLRQVAHHILKGLNA
jgi:hypothetical protein